jgi:FkbM family methyltransferase
MTLQILREGKLRARPMRIIDGGARGGAEPHWDVYGDQLELIAFEPDKEESQQITAKVKNGPGRVRFTCEPMALAGVNGHSLLNLTRYPPASSLLPNNSALTRRFAMAEDFEVTGTLTVETTDVESLMARRGLDYVDFMKLDVEGVELDVLRGAARALEHSLLGLNVEVWFQEDHIGRPLFSDVDVHLRRFGFVLFDLRELYRWRRRTLSYRHRHGGGQLMYANALYMRDLPALL